MTDDIERPKGASADEWCAWFFDKAGYGAQFLGVQVAEALDEHIERSALLDRMQAVRFIKLRDGEHAVCVGGRFDGWLMHRHPDGQWVSVTRLEQEVPDGGAGFGETPSAAMSSELRSPMTVPPLFDQYVTLLDDWRNADHEDSIGLWRTHVCTLLDGIKILRVQLTSARQAAIEECAAIVDQCNHEGPYNAIGAASRIRKLALPDERGEQ